MKPQLLRVLAVITGLCIVPLVKAQEQPDAPAVANPPRYSDVSPADKPYSQATPSANRAVPPELVLPAGTLIMIRLSDRLSSDSNNSGDRFTAILDQPLVAQGWVVARRGQTVAGQVAIAQKAGRGQGVSQLAVELTELVIVDGKQVPLKTELVRTSAGTSRVRDAEGIGTATGVGAMIGAAAGRGDGAAIGAAVGAVAGIAGVLSTRGRATELYPETLLSFRLQDPVTVSTPQAQQAFRPVNQADYSNTDGQRNSPRTLVAAESYPLPPPYYYSLYSHPGYGYYGYYGYGPTIFVEPRAFFGGRGYYRRRR